jgi:hypothetical protein
MIQIQQLTSHILFELSAVSESDEREVKQVERSFFKKNDQSEPEQMEPESRAFLISNFSNDRSFHSFARHLNLDAKHLLYSTECPLKRMVKFEATFGYRLFRCSHMFDSKHDFVLISSQTRSR